MRMSVCFEIGGSRVTGAGGFAGEWGHGPVVQVHCLPCGCDQSGGHDTIGAARGSERLPVGLGQDPARSEAMTVAWRAGEAGAFATVAWWRDLVSGPLAMVLKVVGAAVVPMGGGLGDVAGLIAALDGAVRARAVLRTARPVVVCTERSADAGLVGAAEAAFG